MACQSASVEAVSKKTTRAQELIDAQQAQLMSRSDKFKTDFFAEIAKHLTDAGIKDASEIGYSFEIKTEYTSEFSLDKIAAVVIAALKAAIAAYNPTGLAQALSGQAVDAYCGLVNSVAEAAKSSSSSSADFSFSVNRLSSGIIAFLSAFSQNLKDKDTFGTEAVTTTVIFYRLMQSIDEIKIDTLRAAALIERDNLLRMKTLQAALTDELATGGMTIEEWMKKDDAYMEAVEKIQARLDASGLVTAEAAVEGEDTEAASRLLNERIIRSSVGLLSGMGADYAIVIERSMQRLENNYY